jgi:hypothetical protein
VKGEGMSAPGEKYMVGGSGKNLAGGSEKGMAAGSERYEAGGSEKNMAGGSEKAGPSVQTRCRRNLSAMAENLLPVQERTRTPMMGLLTAPPYGGGDQGVPGEGTAHPKLFGGGSSAQLSRYRAILDKDMSPLDDGNWDDDTEGREDLGFQHGGGAQIGGVVDMEDDVFLEFDKEDEIEEPPREPNTWKLLARYMGDLKPNTKSMFTQFTEEV